MFAAKLFLTIHVLAVGFVLVSALKKRFPWNGMTTANILPSTRIESA